MIDPTKSFFRSGMANRRPETTEHMVGTDIGRMLFEPVEVDDYFSQFGMIRRYRFASDYDDARIAVAREKLAQTLLSEHPGSADQKGRARWSIFHTISINKINR